LTPSKDPKKTTENLVTEVARPGDIKSPVKASIKAMKIGPKQGGDQSFRMIQCQPSGYASKRSSSVPSAEPSSRQSALSIINNNQLNDSDEKKVHGAVQAYGSSCGLTSVDSNYGP